MADNEKLLEAARLIQEHCKKTDTEKPCCFAFGGVCQGCENCRIGNTDIFPMDWDVPKPCRWTDADVNMAKALQASGFTGVFKPAYSRVVLVNYEKGGDWQVPDTFFVGLGKGETVQLSDIIAEGAEQ